jgi:hypothetical protein
MQTKAREPSLDHRGEIEREGGGRERQVHLAGGGGGGGVPQRADWSR